MNPNGTAEERYEDGYADGRTNVLDELATILINSIDVKSSVEDILRDEGYL